MPSQSYLFFFVEDKFLDNVEIDENVVSSSETKKLLQNGQVVIKRNGTIYNILGVDLK